VLTPVAVEKGTNATLNNLRMNFAVEIRQEEASWPISPPIRGSHSPWISPMLQPPFGQHLVSAIPRLNILREFHCVLMSPSSFMKRTWRKESAGHPSIEGNTLSLSSLSLTSGPIWWQTGVRAVGSHLHLSGHQESPTVSLRMSRRISRCPQGQSAIVVMSGTSPR
jgi:hypothetical protein